MPEMDAPTVSVIVVSRGRADELKLCLTAVSQLLYPAFEIVVVADAAGIAALGRAELADQVKSVLFEEANISAARNVGIRIAAGEIIAFIDDDAVPEPTWLRHLCAPFSNAKVAISGGYVRGRNGIRFQCRAHNVDVFGRSSAVEVEGEESIIAQPFEAHAIGTNCAYRRAALAEIGGFDSNYRYFLDESDVNMRLAQAGWSTAVVPLAEVHHGTAESAQRDAGGIPKTLFETGASMAVFHRKFAPAEQVEAAWRAYYQDRHSKLLRATARRALKAADVGRLVRSLHNGYEEGQKRKITELPVISVPTQGFLAFRRTGATGKSITLSGRFFQRQSLCKKAAKAVMQGDIVTLFLFSPTALFHSVRFHPDGYWLQRGGLFGRAKRGEPIIQWYTFQARLSQEIGRVATQRGIPAQA